jgi:hypothetical protein
MGIWAALVLLLENVVLLIEVVVLLLMACIENDMIQGRGHGSRGHNFEPLGVSLMKMMVFHTVMLHHMVMMIIVMTVVIEKIEIILQELSCRFPSSLERKTQMHILIVKSNVIIFFASTILQI